MAQPAAENRGESFLILQVAGAGPLIRWDGTSPHPLLITQCEGTLWVVGRGCGLAPFNPGSPVA